MYNIFCGKSIFLVLILAAYFWPIESRSQFVTSSYFSDTSTDKTPPKDTIHVLQILDVTNDPEFKKILTRGTDPSSPEQSKYLVITGTETQEKPKKWAFAALGAALASPLKKGEDIKLPVSGFIGASIKGPKFEAMIVGNIAESNDTIDSEIGQLITLPIAAAAKGSFNTVILDARWIFDSGIFKTGMRLALHTYLNYVRSTWILSDSVIDENGEHQLGTSNNEASVCAIGLGLSIDLLPIECEKDGYRFLINAGPFVRIIGDTASVKGKAFARNRSFGSDATTLAGFEIGAEAVLKSISLGVAFGRIFARDDVGELGIQALFGISAHGAFNLKEW